MISLVSVFLFIYIVYRQLTDKIPAITWIESEFFNHRETIKKFRTEAIEFHTNTPPKYHTYDELPVM